MPSIEETSYIAGFVDGEGYIGIYSQKKSFGFTRCVRVVITNSDPTPLEMIQTLYGGSLHNRRIKEGWKVTWTLFLCSKKAYNLLKDIRPYLRVKQRQADACILFQERRTGKRGKELRDWDEFLKDIVHILNRRGV